MFLLCTLDTCQRLPLPEIIYKYVAEDDYPLKKKSLFTKESSQTKTELAYVELEYEECMHEETELEYEE